jgi:hypothetical protein
MLFKNKNVLSNVVRICLVISSVVAAQEAYAMGEDPRKTTIKKVTFNTFDTSEERAEKIIEQQEIKKTQGNSSLKQLNSLYKEERKEEIVINQRLTGLKPPSQYGLIRKNN